jgi:hypothetical protein
MKIFHYINRFWQISILEKQLFLNALIWYILYFLLVKIFPLKFYASVLKSKSKRQENANHDILFYKIRKAICRVLVILPIKKNCLINSLVFKRLSFKFNINCSISIVVFKNTSDTLSAHAYVIHDNKPIYLFRKNLNNKVLFINE